MLALHGNNSSLSHTHHTHHTLWCGVGIDLTTLSGDDTPGKVQRLCAKAANPVRPDIMEMLGVEDLNITCGAVCVYPARVLDAVEALQGTGIPVAAVATGFPSGQIRLEHKLEEIK